MILVFFESFSEWLAVLLAVILTWADYVLYHLLRLNPQILYSYVVSTTLHREENSIGFRDGEIREDPLSHR